MAFSYWYATLICGVLIQAGAPSAIPGPDGLLESERIRLERETKLDRRIKVFEAASVRYERTLTGSIQGQNLQGVPSQLKSWTNLLESSLKDVERSTARKDKSKALIHFEIHLRKAISNLREIRLKATVDEFDAFESWLAKAEEVHEKFVDMLFQR